MSCSQKETFFLTVYKEYSKKIYRICYAYVYNPKEVDDLFQEIMINIWNGIQNFKGEAQIGTWVYRVAVNSALFYNRKLKTGNKSKEVNFAEMPDIVDSIDTSEEKTNQLRKAIMQLPNHDRLIVSLLLENLSYQQIADVTGISQNYVGVKISRIKKQLKTLMNHE